MFRGNIHAALVVENLPIILSQTGRVDLTLAN
jgi:hypothetical protein